MVKINKKLFVAAILSATTLGFVSTIAKPSYNNVFEESSVDLLELNQNAKILNKQVGFTSEIAYSKTYSQYGIDPEGNYCLRFATAVCGAIDELAYVRKGVEGINGGADEVKPVNYVYEGIISNGSPVYYDGENITTSEEYAGDYYWACYTICFKKEESKKYYNTDIEVSLVINGETIPSKVSSISKVLDTVGTKYIFEAETSIIETTESLVGVGIENGKTVESTNNPSGDAYVYNIQKAEAGGCSLTFNVTSSKAGPAILTYCMGLSYERTASQLFTATVNGKDVLYYDPVTVFPQYSSKQYFEWTDLPVAIVNLQEGNNEIVLTKNTGGLNFDYLSLITDSSLVDTREFVNGGHLHEEWNITKNPTYESEGKIASYCNYCRELKVETLPIVSEENGYNKLVSGAVSLWNYNFNGNDITIEVEEESVEYEFRVMKNEEYTTDPFASINGGSNGGQYNVDGYYEKSYNSTNKTFTATLVVNEKTNISLDTLVVSTKDKTYKCLESFVDVTVNGSSDNVIRDEGSFKTLGWGVNSYVRVKLGTLTLEKGANVISFTMGKNNLNVLGLIVESVVSVSLGN